MSVASSKAAKPGLNKRRAARFAAVQALYQVELGGEHPQTVVAEFGRHRLAELLKPFAPGLPSPKVDGAWFAAVATGAWEARGELDPVLEACLVEGWSLARCGYLLRATLRAGAYELASQSDVPVAVVINEYVEVAKLFFAGQEPSLINAVLDKAAPRLRPPQAAPEAAMVGPVGHDGDG